MRHNKEKMTETVTLELPEALAEQAKQTVREQGDLSSALLELLEAIESLRK